MMLRVPLRPLKRTSDDENDVGVSIGGTLLRAFRSIRFSDMFYAFRTFGYRRGLGKPGTA